MEEHFLRGIFRVFTMAADLYSEGQHRLLQ